MSLDVLVEPSLNNLTVLVVFDVNAGLVHVNAKMFHDNITNRRMVNALFVMTSLRITVRNNFNKTCFGQSIDSTCQPVKVSFKFLISNEAELNL